MSVVEDKTKGYQDENKNVAQRNNNNNNKTFDATRPL